MRTIDRIEQLRDALTSYGYVVIAEPLTNQEVLFANTLEDALAKVERAFSFNAKQYGFRGRSKNALAALHTAVPHPCFGVEVGQLL